MRKIIQILILLSINLAFSSSSLQTCLQQENCKNEVTQSYGKKLIKVVTAWYPDLLKNVDVIPHLQIAYESNNPYFIGGAVDVLKQDVTLECKSNIKLLNHFPFYYINSGASEAEGRYANMNCFFVQNDQYNILQKCISRNYFNIYDQNRNVLVEWTERKCRRFLGIKHRCRDEHFSRIDVVQDKIICYKQSNIVYDAFVETAKRELMLLNEGNIVKDLLQELPTYGTDFLKSCVPNCQNCYSHEKCIQCSPQYVLINNQCIQCHPTCLTCSEQNNFLSCETCQENLRFYKNQCLEQCPEGFINQNGICQSCDKGCKKCEKMTSYCIECYDGFILQDDKCQEKCDIGFFPNINTLKCTPCSEGCIECNNDQTCKTCNTDYIKKNELCVAKCRNILNCEQCDEGVCSKCNYPKILILKDGKTICDDTCPENGFDYDGIVCIEQEKITQSSEGYYIIGVILILTSVILCSIQFLRQQCKRQNEHQYKQQEITFLTEDMATL